MEITLRGDSLYENDIVEITDITDIEFGVMLRDEDYHDISEVTVTIQP